MAGVSLLRRLCDLTNLRMMMKKLIYMAVLLFAVIAVKAQDYEAFNKFMRDYSKGWMTDYRKPAGNTMEMIKQVGEPAPEFYFDKKLNSKALKGKFIVINFWSTWCGSCINLVHDLDTVLFRNMQPYGGVQFIGVDSHETKPKNGGKIAGFIILAVTGKEQMLVRRRFMAIIRRL